MVLYGSFRGARTDQPCPGYCQARHDPRPGFNVLDLGVYRNFKIWERLAFQFGAEAFNALNHTNVNSIGTTATSGTFGEVTGYRDARIMQFRGKFTF